MPKRILVLAAAFAAALAAQTKTLFHVRAIELDRPAEALLISLSATIPGSPLSLLRPDLDIEGLFGEVRAAGGDIHFLGATSVIAAAPAPKLRLAPGQSFWTARFRNEAALRGILHVPFGDPLLHFIAKHDVGSRIVLLVTPEPLP